MSAAASLTEHGFILPDDRTPPSLLRAVRDFFAPDRIGKAIETQELRFTEANGKGDPYVATVTIESEAAIINDGAKATGYCPGPLYESMAKGIVPKGVLIGYDDDGKPIRTKADRKVGPGQSFYLRASYALRHTDSSPDGRAAIAAWFGLPESAIWDRPPTPRIWHAAPTGDKRTLRDRCFLLPITKPMVGDKDTDSMDSWRKWSLVLAIAQQLFADDLIKPFWPDRVHWLNRVCAEAKDKSGMRRAFNTLAASRGARETIAAWIGWDALAIWPDHLANRNGKIIAAPKVDRAISHAAPATQGYHA